VRNINKELTPAGTFESIRELIAIRLVNGGLMANREFSRG
jgi:hypothetical protein